MASLGDFLPGLGENEARRRWRQLDKKLGALVTLIALGLTKAVEHILAILVMGHVWYIAAYLSIATIGILGWMYADTVRMNGEGEA